MKALRVISLLCVGVMVALFVGCEIVTEDPPGRILKPANNIVINEVFILPPPNSYAYHWIEFYNPTPNRIRIANWTLGFKTRRFFAATDTTGLLVKAFQADTVAKYYDVPFQFRSNETYGNTVYRSTSNMSIPAYNFMTIVSDEDRMKNYTQWGSEGGIRINQGFQIGVEVSRFFQADSTRIDSLVYTYYQYVLENSDQLVLKDSAGTTIDVVRYGNYTYAGPGTDPYPDNHSLGPIVPYQSFARFGGAYKTGAYSNSAEDFYVTGVQIANTIPIPHWLSQAYKQ
jgi:hypothetical protein